MIEEHMEPTTDENCLPARRVATSEAAWAICSELITSDDVAAQDRAIIDGLIDGKAPYNQADLDEAGQSERVNINPKDAAALEEQALRAYYDLLTSVDVFISLEVVFGDSIQRPVWARAIAEEFTKTLRRWNLLSLRASNLQLQYVRHGVSVSFFENEKDWRFRTCGLADFKIRRNTAAAEDEIEVALVRVPMSVSQLYRYIAHPETAAEDGWGVEAVKKIVMQHVNSVQEKAKQATYSNWELLERQIKENDLLYAGSTYHVWIYHLWVKEFDDTVTHLIVPQESAGEEFLYENLSRFKNIHKAFTVFTYGIGDGTYHTIRGMGWKIFDQEQAFARLWNTAMDGAMGNSVTMLQPTAGSNTDITKCAISFNGPFAIIPGGYTVVNRTIPDYTKSVGPVISELKNQIRTNTLSYQGGPSAQDAESMPVKNYASLMQQEMSLTESALDLWYAPWGRLLSEVFARMQDDTLGPEDPGYAEINEMKKRLKEKNVPLEAFYTARDVTPVRAVGSGSKLARLAAFDQAISMGGTTDEEGRYNLVRDRHALVLGQDNIDRYWKPSQAAGVARFNQDQKNAEFENGFMRNFIPGPVSASDNHSLHNATHAGLVQAVMETANEGGEPNVEALEYKYKFLNTAVPHMAEHNQYLMQDPARINEGKMYAKLIQEGAAAAKRAGDELTALMQAQQQAMQAQQEREMQAEQARVAELEKKVAEAESGGDNGEALKLQRELMSHESRMRMKEEEVRQKLRHQEMITKQKLQLQDADNAVKMLELAKVNPYES